jgi:GH15 family glucan-1,4-alpha-glucosidase
MRLMLLRLTWYLHAGRAPRQRYHGLIRRSGQVIQDHPSRAVRAGRRERNWDYRFTWIRDGSVSIYALLGLGYVEEAVAFGGWLRDRMDERAGEASGLLKTMYRVDGSSDLVEEALDHFEGPAQRGHLGDPRRPAELHLRPVALDRAIRLATRARPADIARWTSTRDAVYRQIMERGWNPTVGAFTQHYDTEVLDSSLLLMPLQDFIAPRDPMWLSTLAAMDRELVSDSLVYRYNPASPDGLAGGEGTFSLCTFWYVDALARAGRLEDARLTFEKMLTYANHVGYSEEIGSTGEQLGNFPQAFSHLSLISAAVNLDHQLDHGAGSVE